MKGRDEALYNRSQENEIFIFFDYLPRVVHFVCKNDSLWSGVGAPPAKLYDVLMNLSIKQYFGRSLRRSISYVKLMKRAFKLDFKVLCFKTLNNYLNNPCIRKYLNEIIRYGCELHPVVTIDILAEKGKDNIIFRKHIKNIINDFSINISSADSVYLSRQNCTAVEKAGGKPRFHIKKGLTKKPKGHPAWKRMLTHAEEHPEEYYREYHTRSNVECTNSAKKRKFGDTVHSKNDVAKEQESHLTWCAYNFSILSRAYYELGIEPTEW